MILLVSKTIIAIHVVLKGKYWLKERKQNKISTNACVFIKGEVRGMEHY